MREMHPRKLLPRREGRTKTVQINAPTANAAWSDVLRRYGASTYVYSNVEAVVMTLKIPHVGSHYKNSGGVDAWELQTYGDFAREAKKRMRVSNSQRN